ncbi:AraC family transcriptional regulator ligand-binding domain-containing protein [Nocardia sp. NBC_01009]|uniref:AraC family transcriptional regulator ligand-binding domain-containing protein n=1 Tax=Nocardia sp. NBC_01009 TaxID=2975996 RepID=UPI00386E23E1|nr:AraC family transcriptional regulator [Nocardia sp. NBC_01009]
MFDGDLLRSTSSVRVLMQWADGRIMTGIHTIGQDMLSAAIPMSSVRFRHAAPADTTRHRAVFELEPEFRAEVNELAFDCAYLDIPLPQANDWARDACEQPCRDLLTACRARTGVAGSVRDLMVRNLAKFPTNSRSPPDCS